MSLGVCYVKFASNLLHEQDRKSTPPATKLGGRREILLSSSSSILAAAAVAVAVAVQTEQGSDSRTTLLQKYLKKSQENKAKNDKERLDDYYKRNYRDYFGLLEGSLRGKEEGQLSESEKAILDWLQKNK